MNKKFSLFILAGMSIGASFGIFIGAAIENMPLGIAFGAMGGLFISLFIEAAVLENEKSKRRK